jgi:hypothetical protein
VDVIQWPQATLSVVTGSVAACSFREDCARSRNVSTNSRSLLELLEYFVTGAAVRDFCDVVGCTSGAVADTGVEVVRVANGASSSPYSTRFSLSLDSISSG